MPSVIEQAARWAALIDAGDMAAEEQAACERWCAADPVHRRTLDRMRSFDDRVQDMAGFEREALHQLVERQASGSRAGLRAAMIGIALLAFAGVAATQIDALRDYFPDYRTGRGEQRGIALEDGSAVTLDTDGAIRVALGPAQRHIRLIHGRLLATVAKDPGRPFVVETPHGTATALGTVFTVRRNADDTLVTVIHSKVRVCPGGGAIGDHCLILGAGEQAMMNGRTVERIAAVDTDAAALWATGWLEVDNRPVVEVLDELNRYRAIPIRFDAAGLRGIMVTGSFPLRDSDRALEGIGRSPHLSVRSDGSAPIVERRR